MRIGFIGLGVMGIPMADNLITAGHQLTVHRVKQASQSLVERGARSASSPAQVTAEAEVVILMLPDTPDVGEVLNGPEGVISALRPGTLVIDMSSISPVETREFAREVEGAGGEYVDAPVSGGDVGAREGTLTIFVGGERAAVERAMPLLQVLGKTVTHLGAAGSGQAGKVVNQIIVGVTIEAVAEGLGLAEAMGLDAKLVRDALSGGFASSRILDLHGDRMIRRQYDPGFRLRLHRKDILIAEETAAHHGVELPGVGAVAAQMDAALACGWGDSDHSVLHNVIRGENR